ncbi:MAG TPA: hypothetical protein VMN56_12070 [Casimicrobiaceae bacterium]|nr:hypothetical protein [Casimicrobiaceae bacterium]
MATKRGWRTLLALAFMTLVASMSSVHAQEVPIVTGDQWTTSSNDLKKAYLVGIANLLQVEVAYFGSNPPNDNQSFVPRLARGLRGETLDSVRDKIDRWYASNPTRLSRPVLDLIWFEIVVPGLNKP